MTQKCGFYNLNTLGSGLGIQIKESTLSHCFSITQVLDALRSDLEQDGKPESVTIKKILLD